MVFSGISGLWGGIIQFLLPSRLIGGLVDCVWRGFVVFCVWIGWGLGLAGFLGWLAFGWFWWFTVVLFGWCSLWCFLEFLVLGGVGIIWILASVIWRLGVGLPC